MNCDSDNLHDTILIDSRKYRQYDDIECRLRELNFFNKSRLTELMHDFQNNEKTKDMVKDITTTNSYKICVILNRSHSSPDLNYFPFVSEIIRNYLIKNKEVLFSIFNNRDTVNFIIRNSSLMWTSICIN